MFYGVQKTNSTKNIIFCVLRNKAPWKKRKSEIHAVSSSTTQVQQKGQFSSQRLPRNWKWIIVMCMSICKVSTRLWLVIQIDQVYVFSHEYYRLQLCMNSNITILTTRSLEYKKSDFYCVHVRLRIDPMRTSTRDPAGPQLPHIIRL